MTLPYLKKSIRLKFMRIQNIPTVTHKTPKQIVEITKINHILTPFQSNSYQL